MSGGGMASVSGTRGRREEGRMRLWEISWSAVPGLAMGEVGAALEDDAVGMLYSEGVALSVYRALLLSPWGRNFSGV